MRRVVLKKEDYFRPGENMHIQMSSDYPDYIGIRHSHEYIEVIYIISGQAVHEIEGKNYKVKRGDLFIINVNTEHAVYVAEDATEPFVAYDLMFTPEFFDASISGHQPLEALSNSFMFRSLFRRDAVAPYFSVTGSRYIAFGELFNKIYLEHKSRTIGYREIIRAYLLELIITIYRLSQEQTKGSCKSEQRNRQIADYITDYIKENFAAKFSVSELAKTLYLNPDYLGRIYKKQTGLSISEAIQKVRIEKACSLLGATHSTVAEIAHACGFEDVKFFYTVFKKRMGVLPSDYRKNIKTK